MRVAIAGGSGLIGSALRAHLLSAGHTVHVISRSAPRAADDITWDPMLGVLDARALAGVDAVVNLAGESLAQRWTAAAKQRIRDSRVLATSLLARTIAGMDRPPATFISGSGAGIYGDRGDEPVDERSPPGSDFLADLAREWEGAATPAEEKGVRVAHLRTGLVLTRQGGLLGQLMLPFKAGAGGPIGSGRQWMSWIAMTDMIRGIDFILGRQAARGPFNMTAPNPARSRDFAKAFGRALHRPAVLPAPAFALRLLFGREMADTALLGGQRVLPSRLLEMGFRFRHPDLDSALEAALREGDTEPARAGASR
jgi:uncharacterized protein